MNFRFIPLMSLPITLIFLIPNSQPGWADCRYPYCSRGPGGLGSPFLSPVSPVMELQKLEKSIAQGQAKAADYLRAGEIYTQLEDKAMAETRLKEAKVLYGNLGNQAGVMKVNQKLQILRGSLQRKTVPSEIQIQPRR